MIKIKEMVSDKGIVKGTELEFKGLSSTISAEIGCITKSLIDRAFTDEEHKKIAIVTISTSLMNLL